MARALAGYFLLTALGPHPVAFQGPQQILEGPSIEHIAKLRVHWERK